MGRSEEIAREAISLGKVGGRGRAETTRERAGDRSRRKRGGDTPTTPHTPTRQHKTMNVACYRHAHRQKKPPRPDPPEIRPATAVGVLSFFTPTRQTTPIRLACHSDRIMQDGAPHRAGGSAQPHARRVSAGARVRPWGGWWSVLAKSGQGALRRGGLSEYCSIVSVAKFPNHDYMRMGARCCACWARTTPARRAPCSGEESRT